MLRLTSVESRRIASLRRAPLLTDPRVAIPGGLATMALLVGAMGWGLVVGALMVVIPLALLVIAVWWTVRTIRSGPGQQDEPDERWRERRPWNRRVLRDDSARNAHAWGLMALLILVFLAAAGRENLVEVGLLAGVPAAVAAYHYVRLFRHGRGKVILADFPAFTGDDLRFVFVGRPSLAGAGADFLVENLEHRFAEPVTGVRMVGGFRLQRNKIPTIEGRFSARTSATLDEQGRAAVTIPIPIRSVGTTLAPERSRTGFSWQLQVTASVPGADYSGVFVLPVYEPPRERR